MDDAVRAAFVQQIGRITQTAKCLAQIDDASFLYEVQAAADVLIKGGSPRAHLSSVASAPKLPHLNAPFEPPASRAQQSLKSPQGARK